MTENTQDGPSAVPDATKPQTRGKGPDMTGDPIGKLLIMLAVPAGIGFFFMIAYNLVDTIWANQYPEPGEAANMSEASPPRAPISSDFPVSRMYSKAAERQTSLLLGSPGL